MVIALPLLVCLIGLGMWGFSTNPKLVKIGEWMFVCGLLAFLLLSPAGMKEIGILPK